MSVQSYCTFVRILEWQTENMPSHHTLDGSRLLLEAWQYLTRHDAHDLLRVLPVLVLFSKLSVVIKLWPDWLCHVKHPCMHANYTACPQEQNSRQRTHPVYAPAPCTEFPRQRTCIAIWRHPIKETFANVRLMTSNTFRALHAWHELFKWTSSVDMLLIVHCVCV